MGIEVVEPTPLTPVEVLFRVERIVEEDVVVRGIYALSFELPNFVGVVLSWRRFKERCVEDNDWDKGADEL